MLFKPTVFSSHRSQHVLTTYTCLKGLPCSSQTNMCRSRDFTTARTSREFQQIFWCKGVSLGRVVGKIVFDPSSNEHRYAVVIECLICWRQISQFWCTATLWSTACLIFVGVACQWSAFTLTITCLALVTSSWTHHRWALYAYLR